MEHPTTGLRGHSKIFSGAWQLGTYVDFKNKEKYEDSQSYRPFGDDLNFLFEIENLCKKP